jgi:hypothetical protein
MKSPRPNSGSTFDRPTRRPTPHGGWRALAGLLLLAGGALASPGCATTGDPGRTAETQRNPARDRGPVTLPVGQPLAPEAEPENVERRFGYAEARARRQARDRQAVHEHKQLDYLGPTLAPPAAGATQTPSAPPPAPAPAR